MAARPPAFGYVSKLNDISTRRHKCRYGHLFATVIPRQMRRWGDLWCFSTRSVEGRGGRLKHIGRCMICWRRRSASHRRIVKRKGGGSRVIEQSYNSGPERQLMCAVCSCEDRAHTQLRSRVATTGCNTLKRTFDRCVDGASGHVLWMVDGCRSIVDGLYMMCTVVGVKMVTFRCLYDT